MAHQSKLLSLFNIHHGEGRLVLLVLAHAVLGSIANVLVRTIAFALFLAEFDAQTLPYTFIGVSVCATLASFIYLKLSEHVSLPRMLIGLLALLMLTFVGYWLSLGLAQTRWLAFSLPIYFGVMSTLMITSYWNLLGRLFNLQQGKRLFGLLTSGEHIATVVAGFLAPALIAWIGTINLFLAAVVAMGGALGLLISITSGYAQLLSAPAEESTAAEQTPADSLLRNRYILLIFSMFALCILGIYFIDNIFYIYVEARYPDEDQLASFLSIFFGVVGTLSFGIQLFVSGRLLSRFGLRAVMLLMPAALTVCVALFAVFGALASSIAVLYWLAIVASLFRRVLDATDSSAVNLLYQPLPTLQRTRAQTAVDGILYPVAIGLAGGALLLLTNIFHFNAVQLAFVLLGLLAGWIMLAVLLGREYPKQVRQALSRRSLGSMAMLRPDRSGVAVVRQSLGSPQPGAVIYALDVLEAIAPDELPACLPALLEHRAPEVRLDVLRRVERLGLTSIVPVISRRVRFEGSSEIRGASLRVLATLGDAATVEAVYPALEAADPRVKIGAMVGLLRSGELEGMLAAGEQLITWINSPDPATRIFAAQVLGEARIRTLYRPLLKLMRDETPAVQRAALAVAAKIQNPNLWPVVVEYLGVPAGRSAAQEALVAGGETVLPALEAAFARYAQAPEILMRLAQVCGRVGGPGVVGLLCDKLDFPEARVQAQVLRALNQCGYQADDRAAIERRIKAEAAQAAWVLAATADIAADTSLGRRPGQAGAIVTSALDQALARHRDNLGLWLSFIFDPHVIRQVQLSLLAPADDQSTRARQAYAQEIIEVQFAPELKALVRPLFDDLPSTERLHRLSAVFPQSSVSGYQRLQEIISGSPKWYTPWLRMCALTAVAECAATALRPDVVAALDIQDRLVRETARDALIRLDLAQEIAAQQGDGMMLSPVEKVIHLKAVPFFSDVPEELLAEVAATLEEREIKAGRTIVDRDAIDSSLYIIVHGQVCMGHETPNATTLGENEIFGELTVLDPAPYPAAVTAIEDTLLLRLGQEPFRELADEHRDVAWKIMQLLARRVRWMQFAGRASQPTGDILSEIQDQLRNI